MSKSSKGGGKSKPHKTLDPETTRTLRAAQKNQMAALRAAQKGQRKAVRSDGKLVVRQRLDRTWDRWRREEAVRKAEVAYLTDRQRRPLEYWWEQLCAELIGLSDFQRRAAQGRWPARRREWWDEVQQEVLRQSKFRAVSDRVQELQQVQAVRSDVLEAIRPRRIVGPDGEEIVRYPIQPKSYEGMVRAFALMDQLADGKRDEILGMIDPDLKAEEAAAVKTAVLPPEEMRLTARTLLEFRRASQLKELAAYKEQEDE